MLRADACAAARHGGGERARARFGIGLRAQRHVHAAQEGGVELRLDISRFTAAEQLNAMPMRPQVLDAVAGVGVLCLSMDGLQAARLPESNVIPQVQLQALKNF